MVEGTHEWAHVENGGGGGMSWTQHCNGERCMQQGMGIDDVGCNMGASRRMEQ